MLSRDAIGTSTSTSSAQQQQVPFPAAPQILPPPQRRILGADAGGYGVHAPNELSRFRGDLMAQQQHQQYSNYYNPAPNAEDIHPPQATAHLYGTQPLNYFPPPMPNDFQGGYNPAYYPPDIKPFQQQMHVPPMVPDMMNKSFPPPPQMVPIRASTSSTHASSNDPCTQIAHVLQCYQQGGEEPEYVKKAIESLVKKLKDKRTELDSLITAVTSAGKHPTTCVTIQRSLDGRLQVAGRKGVPHVVYARIWRWPNVNKNELKKLPMCQITNDNQDLICINPYHYERVVSSGIGNIDMATLRIDQPSSSGCPQQVGSPGSLASMNTCQMLPGGPSAARGPHMKEPLLIYSQHQQPSEVLAHTAETNASNSEQWTTGIGPGADMMSAMDTNSASAMRGASQQAPSQAAFSNSGRAHYNHSCRYDVETVKVPSLSPLDHWCSICYYELDTQIGETFKVRAEQSEVIVDGFMDPAGAKTGRFCLGALPNVHRCEASEKARIHIGKGVRITQKPDGSVFIECLSQQAIFVRSYYLDFENNIVYGSAVHKLVTGVSKKIFDLRWAYAEMKNQTESANKALYMQAAAVAGLVSHVNHSLMEHAGTGVDDLRRVCCTIAFSFVKGWGSNYNRTSIKETPCWMEIQLHRPLQLLNTVLTDNAAKIDE
uniref:Mothers against decapentaplegic homolog n=1 Tax=Steinernema glaseri TaxID=37863 RepID=A0A1I7YCX1_9BILA